MSSSFYPAWSASMSQMKSRAPEVAAAFGTFFKSLMKEGALSVREKELIALGIGISLRCEGCIYSHVEKCLKAGVTPEQIIEAAGVAVVMQGGPSYTHMSEVFEALDTFAAKAQPV